MCPVEQVKTVLNLDPISLSLSLSLSVRPAPLCPSNHPADRSQKSMTRLKLSEVKWPKLSKTDVPSHILTPPQSPLLVAPDQPKPSATCCPGAIAVDHSGVEDAQGFLSIWGLVQATVNGISRPWSTDCAASRRVVAASGFSSRTCGRSTLHLLRANVPPSLQSSLAKR